MHVRVYTHRKKEVYRDLLKNSTRLSDFIADHSRQTSWDPSNTGCSKKPIMLTGITTYLQQVFTIMNLITDLFLQSRFHFSK